MRKTIEKRPVSSITKLYRQAWFLFNHDLINKEELNLRLKQIAEMKSYPNICKGV